jgi:hypothetical protein
MGDTAVIKISLDELFNGLASEKWRVLCYERVDLPRFSGEALAHLPACFRIELGW